MYSLQSHIIIILILPFFLSHQSINQSTKTTTTKKTPHVSFPLFSFISVMYHQNTQVHNKTTERETKGSHAIK
ncbi:hypothetical protein QBC43DRAFT_57218 [Cladorrhinum sp. PSN259]|nr:hypothetical protein QBC43DRAFT_57218 [Cladorrhinum sp. PSN259]